MAATRPFARLSRYFDPTLFEEHAEINRAQYQQWNKLAAACNRVVHHAALQLERRHRERGDDRRQRDDPYLLSTRYLEDMTIERSAGRAVAVGRSEKP